MKTLKFQIRHASGQLDQVTVEGERALIGIGAHCEIRLPVDQGKVEHVRIEVVPGGLYATALAFDPQPTLNNIPFSQSPISGDSILGIGSTQIHVVLLEGTGAGGGTNAEKKSSSMLTPILVLALVAAGGYFVVNNTGGDESGPAAVKPPELWKNIATSVCPSTGENAKKQGEQLILEGDAYRERTSFSVVDGINAVDRYNQAAACMTAGGDAEGARYASDAAGVLRNDLSIRYRRERLRLQMHEKNEDWVGVRRSLRILLDFTEKLDPKYAESLRIADREAAKKVSKDKK